MILNFLKCEFSAKGVLFYGCTQQTQLMVRFSLQFLYNGNYTEALSCIELPNNGTTLLSPCSAIV